MALLAQSSIAAQVLHTHTHTHTHTYIPPSLPRSVFATNRLPARTQTRAKLGGRAMQTWHHEMTRVFAAG
jgi:hypothetical protein